MTNHGTSPGHAVFLLACFALAVTPGPAVIYLVSRTLSSGRAVGLSSIGGVALGNFGNALGASLGLAMIFAMSDRTFTAVRLLGAAYLVFLGVKELRRAAGAAQPAGTPEAELAASGLRRGVGGAFRDGFWVALLNPKTTLFFAAFLPQFIDPKGSPLAQSLGLAAVFILVAICTDTSYVLAAARFGPWLAGRGPRSGRYLSGFSFIALGVFVALAGNRPAR